jgi:adiponectin receptor
MATTYHPTLRKLDEAFSPMPDITAHQIIFLPGNPIEAPNYNHDRIYYDFDNGHLYNREFSSMIVVPEWAKDNHYIKTGYRECYKRPMFYIKSIFQWHNESLNIWTHLLATIGYSALLIYSFADADTRNVISTYTTQALAYYLLLFSSVTCYFWSFMMHTFFPISEPVCHWLQRADYIGIFLNMTCMFLSFIYFAYYTEKWFQIMYSAIIAGFSLVFLITFVLMHGCVRPHQQKWRGIGFGLYGAIILIPMVNRISVLLINDIYFLMELRYFLGSAFLFLIGIAFYVMKFPERVWSDGRFDKISNSHTLFHLFTLAGNILCTYGIWKTMVAESTILVTN